MDDPTSTELLSTINAGLDNESLTRLRPALDAIEKVRGKLERLAEVEAKHQAYLAGHEQDLVDLEAAVARLDSKVAEIEAERDRLRESEDEAHRFALEHLHAQKDAESARDIAIEKLAAYGDRGTEFCRVPKATYDAVWAEVMRARSDPGYDRATEDAARHMDDEAKGLESRKPADDDTMANLLDSAIGALLIAARDLRAGAHRPKDSTVTVPVLPTSEADEAVVDALVARRGTES